MKADTFQIKTDRGPITVHAPKKQDASKELSLIILLHGLGADGYKQENGGKISIPPTKEIDFNGMKFAKHVDGDNPFLLVYPNGTQQGDLGYRFWNATDACCDFFNSAIDDAKFLMELAEKIYVDSNVMGKREDLYIVGHSNGGFMAHAMACAYGHKVKAIVSFAGAMFKNKDECLEKAMPSGGKLLATHILQIHGTNDQIVSFGGGNKIIPIPVPNSARYPGGMETVQNWRNLFSDTGACVGKPNPTEFNYNLHLIDGENEVKVFKYPCSNSKASIELWQLKDVGHIPKLHKNFSKTIIDYLFALK